MCPGSVVYNSPFIPHELTEEDQNSYPEAFSLPIGGKASETLIQTAGSIVKEMWIAVDNFVFHSIQ